MSLDSRSVALAACVIAHGLSSTCLIWWRTVQSDAWTGACISELCEHHCIEGRTRSSACVRWTRIYRRGSGGILLTGNRAPFVTLRPWTVSRRPWKLCKGHHPDILHPATTIFPLPKKPNDSAIFAYNKTMLLTFINLNPSHKSGISIQLLALRFYRLNSTRSPWPLTSQYSLR